MIQNDTICVRLSKSLNQNYSSHAPGPGCISVSENQTANTNHYKTETECSCVNGMTSSDRLEERLSLRNKLNKYYIWVTPKINYS